MQKKYRCFSQLLQTVTARTDFTRVFLKETEELSKAYLRCAMKATKSNLEGARKYLEPGGIDITNARACFEDAVEVADIITANQKTLDALPKEEKKILSATYAGYADFLRRTTCSEKYAGKGGVREYVNKALAIDPSNTEAIETGQDIRFNYRI